MRGWLIRRGVIGHQLEEGRSPIHQAVCTFCRSLPSRARSFPWSACPWVSQMGKQGSISSPLGLMSICLTIQSGLWLTYNSPFFKKKRYLFIFRERGRKGGRKRERSISMWLPLTHPLLGTGPATQACALTGIEPETLWFTGRHPIH